MAPSLTLPSPNSARASSVRPEPSRPVMPRISPLRRSKLTSLNLPFQVRWSTFSTGSFEMLAGTK